jgi:four helix bundle protein
VATYTTFEELKCWQAARDLVREVYAITNELNVSKDFALKDQIRRAAISAMSNIAEGYGRNSQKEFIQYLSIARGSSYEVQSQLYIFIDNNYITTEQFAELKSLTLKTANLINGFIKYLKALPDSNYKVKEFEESYGEITNTDY